MKHFEKKTLFAGAKGGGGSTPPKPPTLKPPKIGSYKVGASYQFAEAIDLICDGPIEGLCNKYGKVLNSKELLQGVYLDNVPVQEPIKNLSQVRVLDSQTYESAASSLFMENMNYLFGLFSSKSKEPLNNQKAITVDTIGGPPTKDCTKETTTSYIRYRRTSTVAVYCGGLKRINTIRKRTLYKETTVIQNDKVLYDNSLLKAPKLDESNTLTDSNIQLGKDIPISYLCKEVWSREVSTARDYQRRAGTDTSGDVKYVIDLNGSWTTGGTKYQIQGNLQSLPFKVINLPWRSYVDQNIDVVNTSGKSFWNKVGVTHLNYQQNYTSNFRLEFGQTITNIRDHVFRGYNYLHSDLNCSYPYTQPCTQQEQQVTSLCRKGTQELIRINEEKDSNAFEYEFLKKQFDSLGWEIPVTLSVEWMINQFEQTFGVSSQLIQEIKGTTQRDYCEPFLAFKYLEGHTLEGYDSSHEKSFVDSFGNINPYEFDMLSGKSLDNSRFSANFLIPVLDPVTGDWNGKIKGFYFSRLDTTIKSTPEKLVSDTGEQRSSYQHRVLKKAKTLAIAIKKDEFQYLKQSFGIGIFKNQNKILGEQASKYNYGNILAEFRRGQGPKKSRPLSYFKDSYLEIAIERKLVGPFNTNKDRRAQSLLNWNASTGLERYSGGELKQRSLQTSDKEVIDYARTSYVKFLSGLVLGENGYAEGMTVRNVPPNGDIPEMVKNFTVAVAEGSEDRRTDTTDLKKFDFSGWNSYKKNFDEKAQPVVHIITNPDVTKLFFSLSIESLYDTFHRDASSNNADDLGKKIPTMVNVRVEVGYIEPSSTTSAGFTVEYDRFFRIVSLIELPSSLDIGNPDNKKSILELDYVQQLYSDTSGPESEYKGSLGEPFDLPDALISNDLGEETKFRDRFIRITKLSTESNSTLIFKNLKLTKVVEIIPSNLNYPYSAIVGTKIDSRTFESIPQRTYECRLKRIKIPSNYKPLRKDGSDKRFWDKASELQIIGKSEDVLIYEGDWDGTFKIGWTDNPAWILYDILTSTRYGLGEFLKPEDINKWQLYKIARFCDAVDEDGYFVGVDTRQLNNGLSIGQREPRYSCNMIFTSALKAYDAINMVSSIFKGMVYYNNSVVSFSDDRIKEPVLLFNNSNVLDGFFDYSNQTRDKQYNAIEVSYLDREDNYRNKIEYIEDEEDVLKRGIFKKTSDAYGTTTKAQAIRHAKHVIFATTKENQSVTFTTSLEGLLCQPGDLIIIEDDLKSLTNNFGKVLNVDSAQGTIKISESYDNVSSLEDSLTLYIPTGKQTKEDLTDLAERKRFRFLEFEVDKDDTTWSNKKLNGAYGFAYYTEGFTDTSSPNKQQQYAFYTGEQDGIDHFIWYSTMYTGWVFSTGKSFQHDSIYDKYISQQLYNDKALASFFYINNRPDFNWYEFDQAEADGRNQSQSIILEDSFYNLASTAGAVDTDIKTNETKQILNFKTSSYTNDDFGSTWTIDINDENYNLLPLVPEGSVYRIKRKDTDDKVFKIAAIKELETNKYQVVANKYLSGKYREMEEFSFKVNELENNPYDRAEYESEGRTYLKLKSPLGLSWSKEYLTNDNGIGVVNLNGSWSTVENAKGYSIELRSSSLESLRTIGTESEDISIPVYENGGFMISLTALGESYSSNNPTITFLPSEEKVVYLEVNEFDEAVDLDAVAVSEVIIN